MATIARSCSGLATTCSAGGVAAAGAGAGAGVVAVDSTGGSGRSGTGSSGGRRSNSSAAGSVAAGAGARRGVERGHHRLEPARRGRAAGAAAGLGRGAGAEPLQLPGPGPAKPGWPGGRRRGSRWPAPGRRQARDGRGCRRPRRPPPGCRWSARPGSGPRRSGTRRGPARAGSRAPRRGARPRPGRGRSESWRSGAGRGTFRHRAGLGAGVLRPGAAARSLRHRGLVVVGGGHHLDAGAAGARACGQDDRVGPCSSRTMRRAVHVRAVKRLIRMSKARLERPGAGLPPSLQDLGRNVSASAGLGAPPATEIRPRPPATSPPGTLLAGRRVKWGRPPPAA